MTRTPKRRKPQSIESQAFAVAAKLTTIVRAIPPGAELDEATIQQMIDAIGGSSDIFMMLDERPGYFDGYGRPGAPGYHSRLRQIRNSPIYGPRMFATFRGG